MLAEERDILKKAAAFFAKHQPVRFRFIAAERADAPGARSSVGASRVTERVLRLAATTGVGRSRGTIGG